MSGVQVQAAEDVSCILQQAAALAGLLGEIADTSSPPKELANMIYGLETLVRAAKGKLDAGVNASLAEGRS